MRAATLPPFARGARAALSLPAWVVAVSFLGVGGLARDAGAPALQAALSTVLIWASPAQAIFYTGLAAGAAPAAIAVAVGLSSIRFLPMTLALLPLLRRPGQGLASQALAAHFTAVTVWIEALRRLPALPPGERGPFYFGFALTCCGLSTLATLAGFHLAGSLPRPLAAGLLFLTPMFFAASLLAAVRTPLQALPVLLGFGLAPLMTTLVGPEVDLLMVGLVGGTAAYGAERLARRRR
jgi:predicted branched-subunit amino acid permease